MLGSHSFDLNFLKTFFIIIYFFYAALLLHWSMALFLRLLVIFCLWRDTAKYRPLMKTNLVSHSLKYLTRTYLGQVIFAFSIHPDYVFYFPPLIFLTFFVILKFLVHVELLLIVLLFSFKREKGERKLLTDSSISLLHCKTIKGIGCCLS